MTVLAAGASMASQVEPGVLGFSIVAGIGVVLFFLLRSMNKQLRKVSADRQYFAAPAGVPQRPERPADVQPPQGATILPGHAEPPAAGSQ